MHKLLHSAIAPIDRALRSVATPLGRAEMAHTMSYRESKRRDHNLNTWFRPWLRLWLRSLRFAPLCAPCNEQQRYNICQSLHRLQIIKRERITATIANLLTLEIYHIEVFTI